MYNIEFYEDSNGKSNATEYLEIKTFIILNHFIKQTNKTPKKEIDKARKLFEEYKKRGDL